MKVIELNEGHVGVRATLKEVAPWSGTPGMSPEACEAARTLASVAWYRHAVKVEHEGLKLTGLRAKFQILWPMD